MKSEKRTGKIPATPPQRGKKGKEESRKLKGEGTEASGRTERYGPNGK